MAIIQQWSSLERVQARGLVAQKRNEGDKRVQARGLEVVKECKTRGLEVVKGCKQGG